MRQIAQFCVALLHDLAGALCEQLEVIRRCVCPVFDGRRLTLCKLAGVHEMNELPLEKAQTGRSP